jgi:hypothetical protein
MTKWEYVVKQTNDSELQSMLNDSTKDGLELVTLYPRGSVIVHVVFRLKKKE